MRIVFDLDGTLANITHRLHYIQSLGKKDYESFYGECDKDIPILPTVEVFRALRFPSRGLSRHYLEIWSGRREIKGQGIRTKTVNWLSYHVGMSFRSSPPTEYFGSLDFTYVRMRPHHDLRADTIVKREWLHEAIAADRKPDLIFDDRKSVVNMWREEGIQCFQVAKGEF